MYSLSARTTHFEDPAAAKGSDEDVVKVFEKVRDEIKDLSFPRKRE